MTRRAEHSVPTPESDQAKPVGSYRAFDCNGTLLWEKKTFVLGVDKAPPGVSAAMASMTITGKGGKVLRKWNPWG